MYLTHTLFRSKYKEITIRITFSSPREIRKVHVHLTDLSD